MSVITGETGAGKSLLIDAIGYLSGNRIKSNVISNGKDKAILSKVLTSNGRVKAILEERSRQLKIEAEKQAEEHRKLEEFRASQKAALEKLEKEKKEAEKFEKRKAEAIKKFSDLCRQAKMNKTSADDEDFVIGWLAKHVTRISAEIPDFLESQFIAHFGANAPKTVVNTSMKSSGGFTKKWSLSCQVHVDDLATMPPALQNVFKKSKTVNSTSFALKLIYDYGFNFGKEQDISQIKSMSSDLKAFDLGYSA